MVEFHPVKISLEAGPVLTGWRTELKQPSVLFIAHGNGFCGRIYEPMLELLAERYDLLMLDLPGHGLSPGFEFVGWNQTAEHLWQGIQASGDFVAGRELHAVAHSLGGMLTMLAASRHAETFRSMVMLDPIMFPPRLLFFMHVVHKTGLTSVFHPHVKPTLRRRDGWSSRQEAYEYFHQRKIFKQWTDNALECYVEHALKTQDGPVSIYMGEDTYPFSLRAGRHAKKINSSIDFSIVPGGHCFMQERPADAAGYVFNALDRHTQRGQ